MMEQSQTDKTKYKIRFASLSLALYKEIAAHLSQVEGVKTNLLPTSSFEFNYSCSQVESLQIQYLPAPNLESSKKQVEEILQYYQTIYGAVENKDI